MPSPRQSSPASKFNTTALLIAALIILPAIYFMNGMMDFDLSERSVTEIGFDHGPDHLSGSLILPNQHHDGPIALIIHGDGPQDRFSGDGYLPLFNALLDQNIGIYSWDKAGIGYSSGNWLDQSMKDRATEAVAALDMIASKRPQSAGKIGFLGFSQAGWVIPKAANLTPDNAFGVVIGGAVNWQDQGAFYTRMRLLAEGKTEPEISDEIARKQTRDAVIFAPDATYSTYLETVGQDAPAPMTEDRFNFVKRNITADAKNDLARVTSPILALFGADDLNVDAKTDFATYQSILTGRNAYNEIVLFADATHGLLRSGLFNYQLAADMPATTQLLFTVMGRDAYAPGVINKLSAWIGNVTGKAN
ncbi:MULTISPECIES: alpha/beta hydrolase family protein [Thalassospira]|uniref:CocE/NonD family hydrolase n=1 Tax=Thalassospira aquimaris TaxID=3037796 RepID=A0ABT6GBC1_9PROT|nr:MULTISPECIES: alpha/beta hydrolase [Thalassospira]MDG4719377.1 CocE/NonD family hydrolase [Thalassospira sp. FZY0004]